MAMNLYLKAANQDNGDAQLALARLYKDDDVNLAIYWYNKAMVKNQDQACLGLVDVYMKESDIDENKIRTLLDCVKNKDNEKYLKTVEKFEKYIEDRAAI
jgi:TPR repeat protein